MEKEFKNQSVLITGASGFIGSHLARRLVELGGKVHVLIRPQSDLWRIEDLLDKGITVWEVEVNDEDGINRCVSSIRPRRVFHLAAFVNPARSLKLLDEMIDVNIKGTVTLLKAMEGAPLECFVNVGTCEEYGDSDAPFVEEQRESAVSPYSASKVSATHFCQMIYKITGMPIVTVRPFLTYGPFQEPKMLVPSLIQDCLNNKREFCMTSGEQTREFNYVTDVVEGVMQASLSKSLIGGIVNIGNGKEYKIIDVVKMIVKIMDSSILLNCGGLNHREGEVSHFYSSTEKFNKILKTISATPLEEGLKKTVDWYAKHFKSSGRLLSKSTEPND